MNVSCVIWFFIYVFLTPLAVIFVSCLDTNREYILERSPTNSNGATALHSSLNLPNTLAFLRLYSGWSLGYELVSRW